MKAATLALLKYFAYLLQIYLATIRGEAISHGSVHDLYLSWRIIVKQFFQVA